MAGKMEMKILIIFIYSILFSSNALCVLGEQVDGSQSSTIKRLNQVTYTIHERILSGTTIREYVLPNGIVFGVTWRGMKHPDLNSVLGTYSTEYENLKDQVPKSFGRSPIHVRSSKLSVRMFGHMRDVNGRAYDPNLLPANFSPEDFK